MTARCHYRTAGSPGRPALLFLHGFMGSGKDWEAVAGRFVGNYFCVMPDLPGHGETPVSAGAENCSMEGAARAVLHLLDSLKIEACHLIGYSMGGRLALYLAVHFPARFRRVVLESASPGLDSAAERAARIARDEQLAVRLENEAFRTFLADWYSQPLFRTLRAHPAFDALFAQRLRNEPEHLAWALRCMGTGKQPSLWPHLKKIKLPVFLLTGEFDIKFNGIAGEMARSSSRLSAAVIAECGHTVHFEQPAAFTQRVLEFLNRSEEEL